MGYNSLVPGFRITHKMIKNNSIGFYIFVFVFAIFALFVTGVYNGFKFQFDLINVYENRLAAREVYMPLLFKYLYTIASVIVPLIVIFFLLHKKYVYALCMSFIQFLLFSLVQIKLLFSLFFYLI